MLDVLLQRGADREAVDHEGNTLLHTLTDGKWSREQIECLYDIPPFVSAALTDFLLTQKLVKFLDLFAKFSKQKIHNSQKI